MKFANGSKGLSPSEERLYWPDIAKLPTLDRLSASGRNAHSEAKLYESDAGRSLIVVKGVRRPRPVAPGKARKRKAAWMSSRWVFSPARLPQRDKATMCKQMPRSEKQAAIVSVLLDSFARTFRAELGIPIARNTPAPLFRPQ